MVGLGTLINVGGIVAGGIIGLFFGRLLKKPLQDALNKACGISVIFIGAAGALSGMMNALTDGSLNSGRSMLLVISLVLGALFGELLNLEGLLERFGTWLKAKSGSEGDKGFVGGFVTASLTVCIGAMAIVGSIQDGIFGDWSILATKAVLDLVIILVMTSSMGKGCIFSAIPVAIFQGSVTALSRLIKPLLTDPALFNLSLVGSVLIFCVGINLLFGKKIKVANLLPAVVIAAGCAFLPFSL
ncbi:MAG: DUF554 domain-containing protein [Oscillospiraceae bacterium]|nr:DUF554 domain-containing protein [Oscillospiraceae bacterium]